MRQGGSMCVCDNRVCRRSVMWFHATSLVGCHMCHNYSWHSAVWLVRLGILIHDVDSTRKPGGLSASMLTVHTVLKVSSLVTVARDGLDHDSAIS